MPYNNTVNRRFCQANRTVDLLGYGISSSQFITCISGYGHETADRFLNKKFNLDRILSKYSLLCLNICK